MWRKGIGGHRDMPGMSEKGSSCPKTDKEVTTDKQHIKHNGRYRHEYKSLYAEHNRNCGRFGKGVMAKKRRNRKVIPFQHERTLTRQSRTDRQGD